MSENGSIPAEVQQKRDNIVKRLWYTVKASLRPKPKSPLIILADQELNIYYSPDADYYDNKTKTNMLADDIKKLVKEFSTQGHSGSSAHISLRHFYYLSNFCKLDGTSTIDKNRRAFCGVFNNKQVQKFIKIINEDKEQRQQNKKQQEHK
jgi:hypothetical protein